MKEVLSIDRQLLIVARTKLHQRPLERAVQVYSALGQNGAVWMVLALGGAAASKRRRSSWLKAAAVVPGTLALNYAIKRMVKRSRPKLPGLKPLGGTLSSLSFPSAHACTSFATGHVLSKLVPEARTPLFLAALLMSASRPYLGLHYPSDVVAGALLGSAIGISCESLVTGQEVSGD